MGMGVLLVNVRVLQCGAKTGKFDDPLNPEPLFSRLTSKQWEVLEEIRDRGSQWGVKTENQVENQKVMIRSPSGVRMGTATARVPSPISDLAIEEWVCERYGFAPHPFWISDCKEFYLKAETNQPLDARHKCPPS